ncbi:MAG: alpha/beta hydrolase family protein [Woeseiaceae bacterium]
MRAGSGVPTIDTGVIKGHYYAPVDAIDRQPTRPDFVVLMYPVISMQEEVAHSGSRTRLLGEHASAADVEHYSANMNVMAATSPMFLLHAADDDAVPLQNTLLMYEALRSAGIESELHVFAEGGHGFGLRDTSGLPVAAWPGLVAAWVGRACGGGG